jgi:predicted nuclease of predicted toxin-antitoxin system
VKLLVDAQLPPSLAALLSQLGHDAVHLFDIAPANADDSAIWQLAKREQRVIVTKDEDFATRVKLRPEGLQVVWLRVGNCSRSELKQWLEPLLPSIIEALNRGEALVIAL